MTTLTRLEIIEALRQYAHPSWYHQLLNVPTKSLELLLEYYKMPKETHAGIYRRMKALRPLRNGQMVTVGFHVKDIDLPILGAKPDMIIIDEVEHNTWGDNFIRKPDGLKRVMTFKQQ